MKLFVTTFQLHNRKVSSRFEETQFSLAVDETGALVATSFGDLDSLQTRTKRRDFVHDIVRTRDAVDQITRYFRGKLTQFTLPLAPEGSPFQRRVWAALQEIPFGETRSYGELARTLQSSPRAVGRANATNPICLIVPCHRVIGADGSLTGFAFGEEVKRRLLDHESDHKTAAIATG